MPKFKERDLYLGAALSLFLRYNTDAKPSMIERIDDKAQLIKMLTDTSDEFFVFMKYTTDCRYTADGLISWQFALSPKDKNIIQNCIDSNHPVFIFFICGLNQDTKTGEIAIVTTDEYNDIKHKSSVTIKLKGKRPHYFDIHIGKAQDDVFLCGKK